MPINTNVLGNMANSKIISNLDVWLGQIIYADLDDIFEKYLALYQNPFNNKTNLHQNLQNKWKNGYVFSKEIKITPIGENAIKPSITETHSQIRQTKKKNFENIILNIKL